MLILIVSIDNIKVSLKLIINRAANFFHLKYIKYDTLYIINTRGKCRKEIVCHTLIAYVKKSHDIIIYIIFCKLIYMDDTYIFISAS